MKDGPIIREKPKKQNRMQLKLILFLLLVLALLAAVPYYFLFHSQEEGFLLRSYTYATVDTRTFTRYLNASGTVEPGEITHLYSPLSGVLTRLYVAPGQSIQEGDPVAQIESEDLLQEIKKIEESTASLGRELQHLKEQRKIQQVQEELNLHGLQEEIHKAQEDLHLKKQLFALGTIPRKELEEAQSTLKSLQQKMENTVQEQELTQGAHEREREDRQRDLQQAQAEHSLLLEELEKSQITSPMSGLVLQVKKGENSTVNRNEELFQLINMDAAIVVLKMGESDVARIEEGQQGKVLVANTQVEGKVSFISPQTERGQEGPVVTVHITLAEIPPNLRAYSTAVVEFQLVRRENIPYLPRGDYLTSGEYSFVYLLEGERAQRSTVSFGQHEGTYIEVISGLEIGDEIITSSYEEFKDRREITINREGGRPH